MAHSLWLAIIIWPVYLKAIRQQPHGGSKEADVTTQCIAGCKPGKIPGKTDLNTAGAGRIIVAPTFATEAAYLVYCYHPSVAVLTQAFLL
ncbi:MAG: hypothetical protein ACP5O7_10360 [Phycisphaerae bacterium]